MTTPRDLVRRTLEFKNKGGRAPRDLWTLPWAEKRYPDELSALRRDYPSDMAGAGGKYTSPTPTEGQAYAAGRHVDAWGCIFTNRQEGVIGEVKDPLVTDDAWADTSKVRFPLEWLTLDVAEATACCRATDRFVTAGGANPFERLQYIRGSESLLADLAEPPPGMLAFLARLHSFNCDCLSLWAQTEADALSIADDWGTQRALLISPGRWRQLFKPLYRDYADIAHRAGKFMFMHTDGYTLDIIPDLIEIGIDAVNAQIFCIGLDRLAPYAGRITFWGEVDRQRLLTPAARLEEVRAAVRQAKDALWRDGGCIAQCEFGPGGHPANVRAVYETWRQLLPGG